MDTMLVFLLRDISMKLMRALLVCKNSVELVQPLTVGSKVSNLWYKRNSSASQATDREVIYTVHRSRILKLIFRSFVCVTYKCLILLSNISLTMENREELSFGTTINEAKVLLQVISLARKCDIITQCTMSLSFRT